MIQSTNTGNSILAQLIFIVCVDLGKQQGLLCNSQAVTIEHFLLCGADIDMLNVRRGQYESFITDLFLPNEEKTISSFRLKIFIQ